MNKNKESRLEKFRPYAQLIVTSFVELFTQAVCATVMKNSDGNKLAKIGAHVGAGLIGLMVGDQVSDYICDGVDEFMDSLDEVKETIEEAKDV